QLETVREFNVAPRLVVPDQRSGRSALVSADATQIVDGSYRVLATLPGGVSAAFSKRDDFIVVLSPSGADSLLTFAGFGAPQRLHRRRVQTRPRRPLPRPHRPLSRRLPLSHRRRSGRTFWLRLVSYPQASTTFRCQTGSNRNSQQRTGRGCGSSISPTR